MIGILLTLVMLGSLLPAPVQAATAITPKTPAGSGTAVDPYRIGTAAELYGFAEIVNGEDDADTLDGDQDAHAILTADITVNENVLSDYGQATGNGFVAWDPINLYEGVFDGRGHTISGLYIWYTSDNHYDHCGFFEVVRGVVRDLTISDSYYRVNYGYDINSNGIATTTSNRNIGGICGELGSTGTVWRCHFDGVIDADQGDSTGGFKIGGIVGYNFNGVVKECSVSGRVDGKAGGSNSGVGGIVGVSSGGTVTRCCSNASVTNVISPSAAKKGQSSVGGIVGCLRNGTVTDSYTSYNRGNIWGYGYMGGIVGSAEGCDIQRCWNFCMLSYLEAEYQEDTYIYMGGILGHAGGTKTSNVIKNCYNHGTIYPGWKSTESNPYVGAGIVGNYDDSMGAELSISYCHNMGKYVGDRLYNNASETYNPIVAVDKGTISNCYYKIADNEVGERDYVENTVAYQLRDFKNGTVVDLLNDQPLFDNQNYWEQDSGALPMPVLIARPEIVSKQLEITVHPDREEYTAGEAFDPTGMLVQMHYTDGSLLPVVGYTVVDGELLLKGHQWVQISYTEDGVTYTADQYVEVTGENPKFTVTVGSGGSGGGSYEVGSRVTIKATVPTGAQFIGWSGLNQVRITMGSVTSTTVTFIMPAKDVTATPVLGTVRSIEITTPPDKTVYYAGEDFDPTGMVVTAYVLTVPGNQKVSMPIKNYTISGGSPLLEGQTKVTVSYRTGTGTIDVKTASQPITVLTIPKLVVNNGSGGGSFLAGTVVTATAEVGEDQIFRGWSGLGEKLEILEGSASTASVTFVMPDENVTLQAELEAIETARPKGSGTEDSPFEIGTMAELYWFRRFVNGTITAEDLSVTPAAACAKLVQDITVNPDLLTSDGVPAQTIGLANWTPIGMNAPYTGTFDGQNHTVSGMYCDRSAVSSPYAGFFGMIGTGGTVRDLTLKDSYFCVPTEAGDANVGGIVGLVELDGTVENCHFDGTVTTDDSNGDHVLGGIAGTNLGVIRDCTAKGQVCGFGVSVGGIAGRVHAQNGNSGEVLGGEVLGCVNEATVKSTMRVSDNQQLASGGIVGLCVGGIIKNCCNKGDILSDMHAGGIVGRIEGQGAAVLRCWNEGRVAGGAGIVFTLGTYADIQNCYNAGKVSLAGIVGQYQQGYNTITHCHNVGEVLGGYPISAFYFSDSVESVVIKNCFYLDEKNGGDDSSGGSDLCVGTYGYNSEMFGSKFENVCRLLNSGSNAHNWVQGETYPVLNTAPVAVSGDLNVSGASAVPIITVASTPSEGATLVIVQYSDDQQTDVKTVPVAADGTFTPDTPFAHKDGCTYKTFLLDPDTSAPLSPAAWLSK